MTLMTPKPSFGGPQASPSHVPLSELAYRIEHRVHPKGSCLPGSGKESLKGPRPEGFRQSPR
jgi:hypothetical protein